MEKYWLKKEGNDRLAVFVLGWASGHRLVEHIPFTECDVLCIYDYRDAESVVPLDDGQLGDYNSRYIFAWSFGVLIAEKIFGGGNGNGSVIGDGVKPFFTRAVALNGTPFPVDERFGIEPRRLAVTIRGLEKGGMEPFDTKAYGDHYGTMKEKLSPRSIDDNIVELRSLEKLALEPYTPVIEWDRAVVGSGDLVFSPRNMLRYWGERAQVLPLPHYPFADVKLVLDELGNR